MKVTMSKSAKFDTHICFLTKESKIKPKDFEGKKGEISIRYKNKNTILYCGLGEIKKYTDNILRSAAANGIRKAIDLKRKRVSIIEPKIKDLGKDSSVAIIEGAVLGSYAFAKYKSEKPKAVSSLEFVSNKITPKEAKDTATICESINYARDLVNENATDIYPERLAKEAQDIASLSNDITCTVLTEKEIKEEGLGLLYAVGQGSSNPPRLAIIEYKGNPESKKKLALIGKGITFDSGGQNLKPTSHIETMRCDMAGAATVLGLLKALAQLKPAINVIGVIPAAHNAIDSSSYLPGDTYTSFSGKTVEVLNTDAEGRLALADAIAYCIKNYSPSEIIDLATLTGSIISALGDTIAGLFSNNDSIAEKLFQSGEKTGERLWRLPIYDEHREAMKSDIADIRNISKLKKGYASSITGAAFIESFVKNRPWAHLDIAGTAFNEGELRGEVPKFGTGFGIRLLLDYLLNE